MKLIEQMIGRENDWWISYSAPLDLFIILDTKREQITTYIGNGCQKLLFQIWKSTQNFTFYQQ